MNLSNKKNLLAKWMQQKQYFATHEVVIWGVNNYYTSSADRIKRKFKENNLIRKLSKEEKILKGFKCKDAVYEWINL